MTLGGEVSKVRTLERSRNKCLSPEDNVGFSLTSICDVHYFLRLQPLLCTLQWVITTNFPSKAHGVIITMELTYITKV